MLDIVGDIMGWLITFVEVISAVTLFDSIMERKDILHDEKIAYVIEIITLFLITNLIAHYIDIYHVNNIKHIVFPLLYLVITLIFYKSNIVIRLGFSITFYTMLIGIDYCIFLMISSYLSISKEMLLKNPLLFFMAAAISKSIHFLIIITFKRIVSKDYSFEYISKYHWFTYIMQSIVTTIALFSIINISFKTDYNPIIVIIAPIGLLFLNIAVYGLLESSARLGNNVRENALLKQQVEIELNNIKILSQAFEVQRQSIHDYTHNLGVIYQLLDMDKHQDALNYVKSLSEDFYHSLYRIKTNHSIIDAILNLKDMQAKRIDIVFDVRAGNLSDVIIPDDLLVTIMCNILDNAIEACKTVKVDKIVSVKCVNEDGLLIFSVINPVSSLVKITDNKVATTKDDRLVHGTGLKNVSIALSKCNGDYELFCDNHKFQFTAFIRLSN